MDGYLFIHEYSQGQAEQPVYTLLYFCRLLCLKLLRTGREDPHRHEQEFLFYYLIYYLAISTRLRFL